MQTINNNRKTGSLLKAITMAVILISAVPAFAQDELTPFEEDVQDVENEAPINGFVHFGIAVALIIGYRALHKKKQLL